MNQLIEFAANHPLIIGAIVAAWSAVMFYELRLRNLGTTHVSTADAVRLINKGALVIDVRKPEEFAAVGRRFLGPEMVAATSLAPRHESLA